MASVFQDTISINIIQSSGLHIGLSIDLVLNVILKTIIIIIFTIWIYTYVIYIYWVVRVLNIHFEQHELTIITIAPSPIACEGFMKAARLATTGGGGEYLGLHLGDLRVKMGDTHCPTTACYCLVGKTCVC